MSDEFFNAPAVRAELTAIFTLHDDISALINPQVLKFLSDEERDARINKVIALIEKQKIFYTRLQLEAMEDDRLIEVKSRIDAIGNTFGFNGTFSQHADTMINRLKKRLTSPD